MGKRNLTLPVITAILVAVLLVIAYTRSDHVVVLVDSGDQFYEFTLTYGSKIKLVFNNSVTGSLVMLVFEVDVDGFKGVSVITDEATVEYYSGGVVDVNNSMRMFKSSTLSFCTSDKVVVEIGGYTLMFVDRCLHVRLKS